ncbi:cbb3-type cytochrome oxidase assembly protein CcoS [Marinilongibacter aquaticus]|uniref:cbb3-type cytochrome oxidase assembly protein CcoS n=1 Tax=Marinilongibacter aquaticus TaxID=2975157 RepID=UPI0021BDCE8E|nr:cbb3-type cytochrome oxidase assembly protein CcoS [Marinilongibacter aquaticus]UBM58553.1 cbb3-type cytochrome oxidase assembly protein CcoS [Marinilongibacter aquaticus]
MEIIFLMIAVSIFMALAFLVAFVWAVKSGQTDDLEGPAIRILTETHSKIKNK